MTFSEISVILFMAMLIYQLASYSPKKPVCLTRFFVFAGGMIMINLLNHPNRWQLSGVYLLFLVLLLYFILQKRRRKLTRLPKFLIIISIITLILSGIIAWATPNFSLPKAQGPYSIGSQTFQLVNSKQYELLTKDPDDKRAMTIQVWYPSDQIGQEPDRKPYIENGQTLLPALSQQMGLPEFTLNYLKDVQSNAYSNLPLTESIQEFPVLIFLSGNLGFKAVNSLQMEFLAANGFIVIGIDQAGIAPGVETPKGEIIPSLGRDLLHRNSQQSVQGQAQDLLLDTQIEYPGGLVQYFAQDVSFLIDYLESVQSGEIKSVFNHRLNFDRISLAGVSLGGINTAQACALDPRITNCIIMDAPIYAQVAQTGLAQNLLILTRSESTMKEEQKSNGSFQDVYIQQTLDSQASLFQNSQGHKEYVEIEGSFHLNFTDAWLWSPLIQLSPLTGPIDNQAATDQINQAILNFLSQDFN